MRHTNYKLDGLQLIIILFSGKKAIENSFIFEKELNQIGGEDQLFFLQLNKIGKRIIWNKKALV